MPTSVVEGSFVGESSEVVEEDSSVVGSLVARSLVVRSSEVVVVVVEDNSAPGGCPERSCPEGRSLAYRLDVDSSPGVLYVTKNEQVMEFRRNCRSSPSS